ncbi:class I SAM-dependent methyltransferase [Miltoncostaea oceani]|uniref:class I SAM-dependent methyltransferase n=1 Tax=Miltoncostaea oceani TaxID=2843216 RepID=UPI001C3E01FC|nr:class I SAM-dependent methyltransferase [Miltoncostaea oceani]
MTGRAPLRRFLRGNPFPHPYTEGFYFREKMRAIHRVAPDREVRDVLEVGGGRSGLSALLYPGARVVNVDIDPSFAAAPPNRGRTRFVHGDATALPFEAATFDAVTMFDVIEHIPDDRAAIDEALRVLRPGGVLLLTTPNETWRFPSRRWLQPICRSDRSMMDEWGHVRRGYARGELAALVGAEPVTTATFITPVTSIPHDIAFSRLPSPLRRLICTLVSPVTWFAYARHRATDPGTETAYRWDARRA